MGLDRLRRLLRSHQRIALDTSVFIYHLQAHPKYLPLTDQVLSRLEQPGSIAVTSTITMTELLVQPCRDSNQERVDQFYGLLSTYPNLEWIAPSLEIATLAAEIRAAHRLRTPDALQAATALHAHATALVTNDPKFRRITTIETLVLDEFI